MKKLEFENKDFRQPKVKSNPPPIQGYYQVNERTRIGIPHHLEGEELELWKSRMNTKYNNYDKRSLLNRLSGASISKK